MLYIFIIQEKFRGLKGKHFFFLSLLSTRKSDSIHILHGMNMRLNENDGKAIAIYNDMNRLWQIIMVEERKLLKCCWLVPSEQDDGSNEQ